MASSCGVNAPVLKGQEQTDYNDILYKVVRKPFKDHINPSDFMDSMCVSEHLSRAEMERIKKVSENRGDIAGAEELFEFLTKKTPKWFDIILQGISEPRNKLMQFKDTFYSCKDKADILWEQEMKRKHESDRKYYSHEKFQVPGDPESDFSVDISSTLLDLSLDSSTTAQAVVKSRISQTISDPLSGTHHKNLQRENHTHHSVQRPSSFPCKSSSEEIPVHSTERKMMKDGDSAQFISEEKAFGEVLVQSRRERSQNNDLQIQRRSFTPSTPQVEIQRPKSFPLKEPPHLDEYCYSPEKDFDKTFVTEELKKIPGWSCLTKQSMVLEALRSQFNRDGIYIIWFWESQKRPAITITLKGQAQTYIIHKQSNFYINAKHKKSASLSELVLFHIEHGVEVGNDKKIWLKIPFNNKQSHKMTMWPSTLT